MKTDIWMPWYISDYEKDTKALSLEEDCIYRRALDYLWQNPAGLPRDTVRLSRCLRLTEEESKRLKWVLEEYLEIIGDKYKSERVNKEYEKALQRAEIARENGKKGGRPLNKEKPSGIPSGLAMANPDHNPRPNPDHNPEKSSSPSPTQYNTNTSSVVNTYMSSCEKIDESKSGLKTNEKESEVFDYWKEKLEHPKSVLDKKRLIAIRARLKEGYTVERIKEAIDGIKNSPHNMGQNDRQTVFDDIELICRSGANVDRFADMKKGAQNVSKLKFDKRTEGVRAFMQEQSRIRSIRSGANDSSGSLPEPRDISGEINGDV